VDEAFRSDSRSLRSSGVVIFSKISIDLADAFWKASEMLVGWIPGAGSKKDCFLIKNPLSHQKGLIIVFQQL